jgi:predicted AlkP superfamily phosphohydrolase/phosphomutase
VRRLSLPRTLAVGLDGATPELFFGGIERGELPVLASLLDGAAFGPLRSTLPPMTLPAWSSFLTGRPPGVHGIFDFCRRDPETGRLRFVDARDRAVPTVPRMLSDRGLRVGTFLFPTTWPPEPLSGGQISGFDSPVATRVPPSACSPPSLHGRIRGWLGHDLAYADFSELRKGAHWEARAAASLLQGIADKEQVACRLLQEGAPYDFFGILFGEADTACHHFWHLADPGSPRHDPELRPRYGDTIAAVYRRLDAALGAILAADPGFESVIVVSDHGFGGASDRVLHLNAFLAQQGFLHWQGSRRVGRLRASAARIMPRTLLERVLRRAPRSLLERIDEQARWGAIDLARTEAFSDELDYAPSIRLHAEPVGRGFLVDRLERALLDWRDPTDGGCVVRAVHRNEDLNPGPCSDRAPELWLELETPGGYSYCVLPSGPGDPPVARLPRSRWRGSKGAGMSGSHRRDGIYVMRGPGIVPGRRSMDIEAVLPTWLRAANGSLDEIAAGVTVPAEEGAPEGDPDALAERLRSLGYLG